MLVGLRFRPSQSTVMMTWTKGVLLDVALSVVGAIRVVSARADIVKTRELSDGRRFKGDSFCGQGQV